MKDIVRVLGWAVSCLLATSLLWAGLVAAQAHFAAFRSVFEIFGKDVAQALFIPVLPVVLSLLLAWAFGFFAARRYGMMAIAIAGSVATPIVTSWLVWTLACHNGC